ncbi:hypothetical protein D3C78_976210 [compost metagenome]
MENVTHLEQIVLRQHHDLTTVDVYVMYVVLLQDLIKLLLQNVQRQALTIAQLFRREVTELTLEVTVVGQVEAEVNRTFHGP